MNSLRIRKSNVPQLHSPRPVGGGGGGGGGAARPADHATQIGLDRAVNRGLQQLQPVALT